MNKYEFRNKLNEEVRKRSLLQHALFWDTLFVEDKKTFSGKVYSSDLDNDPSFAMLYSTELMMVVPERKFFKGNTNRCNATIDDIVSASTKGVAATAIMSRHRVKELPRSFVEVPRAKRIESGLLGTLGSVRVFTDSSREPEHLVFGMEDLYFILDDDKPRYNFGPVELNEDNLSINVYLSVPW